jgi:low affinity Fe/Cu permease
VSWKESGSNGSRPNQQTRFERFAHHMSEAAGHPTAFALALLVILGWAVTGPIFHFDSTWQLVINTGTTIVTFLMVFLIQCMQNRDTAALQLKLDELLRAIAEADNDMIEVEQGGEATIQEARERVRRLADQATEQATEEEAARDAADDRQPTAH